VRLKKLEVLARKANFSTNIIRTKPYRGVLASHNRGGTTQSREQGAQKRHSMKDMETSMNYGGAQHWLHSYFYLLFSLLKSLACFRRRGFFFALAKLPRLKNRWCGSILKKSIYSISYFSNEIFVH
jgi:hypothetical protein